MSSSLQKVLGMHSFFAIFVFGFDSSGFDSSGFDSSGFDSSGLDSSGFYFIYYI
jgi:hypothetical protein